MLSEEKDDDQVTVRNRPAAQQAHQWVTQATAEGTEALMGCPWRVAIGAAHSHIPALSVQTFLHPLTVPGYFTGWDVIVGPNFLCGSRTTSICAFMALGADGSGHLL